MHWKKKVVVTIVILLVGVCAVGIWKPWMKAGERNLDAPKATAEGILVHIDPLTICTVTDSETRDRILIIGENQAAQNLELSIGEIVTVHYASAADVGPPVLEEVSKIEVTGMADEEEIAEARRFYEDYMLSLRPR